MSAQRDQRIKDKYYENIWTFIQNSLENVFPKNIATSFLMQNVTTEISEQILNFDMLVKANPDLILETEMFLKRREATPLTNNAINLSVLKDLLTEKVYKQICDEAYVSGKPIISDDEYDYLFGNNATAMIPPVGQVVALPMWMGSLNKVKTEKDFNMWLKKVRNTTDYVVISPKMDGVSALMSANHMYSRGSGNIGSSLDRLLPFVKKNYNNPLDATEDDYIRGELIIDKTSFNDKYASTFKNARNFIAGQISKINVNTDILKDISFVPYEWIDSSFMNKYPSEQLQYMHGNPGIISSLGFIWLKLPVTELSYEYLNDLLNSWSLSVPYDIDGLVIVPNLRYYSIESGNPALNIAFKKETSQEESAVVKVLKVVWSISKWGAYKPVVYIEPVLLDGSTISKVTGHNAKTILERQIGPGAVIKIVRSGKVIPYIVDVLTPSNKVVIPEGTWKGTDVYKKTSSNTKINAKQQIKGLTELFKKIGLKNINVKTIEKLYYECNLKTFFAIINATPQSIAKSYPLGEKKNKNIITELTKVKHEPIQAHILVSASGVLGQGIGEQKTAALLNNLGYMTVPTLEEIMAIEGFAKKTAEQVLKNFPNMQEFIETCKNNNLQVVISYKNPNLPIICLSGFRDKTLEEKFEVKENLSKDVQYLVVLSKDKMTEKVKKAQEYGIQIITRDELNEIFND
jgi:DNA ligase (NAD+)